MAPKSASDSDNSAAIIALCYMMMSSPDFQVDNNYLAPIFNLTGTKNVPRKINSYINPHGFEYKAGKITITNEDNPPTISASINSKAAVDNQAVPKTPKTPRTPKTPVNNKKSNSATPIKKSAKKRKIEEAIAADDDDTAAVKKEDGHINEKENVNDAGANDDDDDDVAEEEI